MTTWVRQFSDMCPLDSHYQDGLVMLRFIYEDIKPTSTPTSWADLVLSAFTSVTMGTYNTTEHIERLEAKFLDASEAGHSIPEVHKYAILLNSIKASDLHFADIIVGQNFDGNQPYTDATRWLKRNHAKRYAADAAGAFATHKPKSKPNPKKRTWTDRGDGEIIDGMPDWLLRLREKKIAKGLLVY